MFNTYHGLLGSTLVFIVHRVMGKHKISHSLYLVSVLLKFVSVYFFQREVEGGGGGGSYVGVQ